MKKIKNKLIKQSKNPLSLYTNASSNNPSYRNYNLLTECYNTKNKSKNQFCFNKNSIDFNHINLNTSNNNYSKSVKLSKAFSDNINFKKTINLDIDKSNINNNDIINNSIKSGKSLPFINNYEINKKQNPAHMRQSNSFKNNFNIINNLQKSKTNVINNERISIIKNIFNKNDNNQNHFFTKGLKNIDDSKYKYSSIIKNLDIWDKDHCKENRDVSNKNLFFILFDYFEQNKLTKEKEDLIYASNVIKSRLENNFEENEGKSQNKIFLDLINRKKRESGTILKNNLYKTQLKFSELFDIKYKKAFDENLDIDPDTFNLLLEDEMKNLFYNQIIKDRIKYEKQLHDDLLKINNIIYKKKNLKHEKSKILKQYEKDLAKLNKEYNEKYSINRKTYWIRYDSYEHYYKALKKNGNFDYINVLKKRGDDFVESDKRISIKDETLVEKTIYKSPNPKKRRTSIVDKNSLSIYKNNFKSFDEEKKFRLLQMNNEMNAKLRELKKFYDKKANEIISKQKIIENEIKVHKLEINYYKGINDELIREHKVYYMNKLKKGYDCRKEGIMWIVYNLLELQVPLEYHHFPKYLTHEQIDYLKKYAKAQLKQDELKIIINALKKKQNTQKMKNVLKCMDVIDNILNVDNKDIFDSNDENEINNKEFINSKLKIEKKFWKLYQENIDIMKNYLFKNAESNELNKIVHEFKKDLYHGSNSDINKSRRDLLNVFMGDTNNKNFFNFLVDIKANYQKLEEEKEKLFENEKQNYLKLVESNMNNKASIDNVIKNEMIKRCLFGNRLDI